MGVTASSVPQAVAPARLFCTKVFQFHSQGIVCVVWVNERRLREVLVEVESGSSYEFSLGLASHGSRLDSVGTHRIAFDLNVFDLFCLYRKLVVLGSCFTVYRTN